MYDRDCIIFLLVALVVIRVAVLAQTARNDARIVGGEPTSIEYHPHQVSLQRNNRHICGGSIISETWVVTAAHCVSRGFASSISIKAGTSRLSNSGTVISAKNIIVHDDYSKLSSDYDIAVIELEEPLEYSSKIKAIDLASYDDDYRGSYATVTGWGLRQIKGSIPDQLQEVDVPVVSSSECEEIYSKKRRITDRMLCAGWVGEGGRDACFGDSGGPLVQNGQLIGIVSWGYKCAHPTYPGVYTRVTALRTWITDQTGM